ncbi:MAG: cyclic nucleotide-binding domain-containing protein [Armatimonadetes bacterium]|nr:cyclic nucleotide-binding domain-containing protein [Armatimonadota bacterium]
MLNVVRTTFRCLRQTALFADIPDEEIIRLAKRALLRQYTRGQVVATPGLHGDLIYLILKGCVKLSRYSPAGKEQIMTLLNPGALFGELSLVGISEPVHAETVAP